MIGRPLAELLAEKFRFIRSGCTLLDLALGGGWAKGRVANIIGDEQTGKTLLALIALANYQRQYPDDDVNIHDAESTLDIRRAIKSFDIKVEGVGYDDEHQTIGSLYTNLKSLLKKSKESFYLLDSLDAVSAVDVAEDDESDKDEPELGNMKAKLDKPALISDLFSRLAGKLKKHGVTFFVISQTRQKVGVMFGEKWTINGGKSLAFYASQRIKLAVVEKIKDKKKRTIGVWVKVQVIKNKMGEPFHEVSFPIYYDRGIDNVEACVEFLFEHSNAFGKKKSIEFNGHKFKSSSDLIDYFYEDKSARKELIRLTQEVWNKEIAIIDSTAEKETSHKAEKEQKTEKQKGRKKK